jgi:putative hemolysin
LEEPPGSTLWTGIAIIVVLVAINALFAGAEIALASVRPTRLRQLAAEGNRRARVVLRLLDNSTRMFATIQVAVTLAGFLASATAAVLLEGRLQSLFESWGWNWKASLPGALGTGVAVVIVTVLVAFVTIVFGELVPKRWAIQHAERYALATGWWIDFFAKIGHPFVWLLTEISNFFVRLLRTEPGPISHMMTEEEIKLAIEESEAQGEIEEGERRMLHSVFEFTDTTVREVMTPRTEMAMVDVEASFGEILEVIGASGFTRIPVYEGSVDNIIGIVHAKDLLGHQAASGHNVDFDVRQVLRETIFVPESKRLHELLAEFRTTKQQMAIVVDEYGGTSGLVTIEDLLEEIVGEIEDEYDKNEVAHVQKIEDRAFVVPARMDIEEMAEEIGFEIEDIASYETVGGLVQDLLGRIPKTGEMAQYQGLHIEVLDADRRRVRRVKVTIPEPLPEEEEEARGNSNSR